MMKNKELKNDGLNFIERNITLRKDFLESTSKTLTDLKKERVTSPLIKQKECEIKIFARDINILNNLKQSIIEFEQIKGKLTFDNGCLMSGFDLNGKHICAMPLEEYDKLQKAYDELEAIKDTEPTKALESLKEIESWNLDNVVLYDYAVEQFNTIKQALIQKITWKHIHNTNVRIPLCDIVNGRTQEERFKIIEDIYYTWEEKKEKLDDEIILLKEKNKQLKNQNSDNEKFVEIVIKKEVDVSLLKDCIENGVNSLEDYNFEMHCRYNNEDEYKLTKKEFNILKQKISSQKQD